MGLKAASVESRISEYTLRQWCKQKKICFNIAGSTKYILNLDWLEVDLERLALENLKISDEIVSEGKLRRVED